MESANHVFIIAEAGLNHNGSIEKAIEMIHVAKEAGVDAVKFQTAVPELVITKEATKAEYQLNFTENDETQLEMLKKLHLPLADYKRLKDECDENNIEFMSAPFDEVSIETLKILEMKRYKIPSGEISNLPYLRQIGRLGRVVIISTGMSMLDEIRNALNILIESGTEKEQITILHCNTEYPTPMEDVNLKAMLTIRDELGVKIGYSDHTLGIEVAISAVALGATVIEKHFTLDRNMSGPDHAASLEPKELKVMVTAIRNREKAMGDGIKKPSSSEAKNISVARKSIVAKRSIKKGELFTEETLTVKRPGTGISPMEWDEMIGKQADREYQKDDLII
jgi:N,N'-diacetyllegionaminate synthase